MRAKSWKMPITLGNRHQPGQISSIVMASSGQTETQDSQPRQSAGLATWVSLPFASSTSAGQTSIHSPHCLHLPSSIFGKNIQHLVASGFVDTLCSLKMSIGRYDPPEDGMSYSLEKSRRCATGHPFPEGMRLD